MLLKIIPTFSPLGLNATHVTSDKTSIVSCSDLLSKQFQTLMVLSQEPDTKVDEEATGAKAIDDMGASCPLITSNKVPSLTDHK